MADCREYTCEAYGGAECPGTRLLDRVEDYTCGGPYNCENCKHMDQFGERWCTVGHGQIEIKSDHYCYFPSKSGFERKER